MDFISFHNDAEFAFSCNNCETVIFSDKKVVDAIFGINFDPIGIVVELNALVI